MNKKNIIFCVSVAAVAVISAIAVAVTYNLNNSDDSVIINVSQKSVETFSDEMTEYDEDSDINESVNKVKETKNKQTTKKKTSKTKTRTSSRKSSGKNSSVEDSSAEVSFPIELNSATVEELCYIDGVGETLAANIIAYRDSIGGYTNRVQLLEVNGIGEVKYAAIKEYLYIENEQELEDVTDEIHIDEPAGTEKISEMTDEADIDYSIDESDEDIDFTEDDILIDDFIYVELNSAELDDLKEIPCFDEEMCLKILELRDEIGGFSDTYELFYIDGMTKTLFCEAEKYIYVESEDVG